MKKSLIEKSFVQIVVLSAALLSGGAAYAGGAGYVFGDEPYRLNWGYDPDIQSGCRKWNWQQYGWDDYCPIYFHPKAYMYPRSSRVMLRTRG
jgi:hypothetical protein